MVVITIPERLKDVRQDVFDVDSPTLSREYLIVNCNYTTTKKYTNDIN